MGNQISRMTRSRMMASVKSSGNRSTEVFMAALMRRNGITGWRRNYVLFGKPDFVFDDYKVAIFVDGCFWHGCPWHCRKPQSNVEYWNEKIARNKTRDKQVTTRLTSEGWTVIRVWEHSLKDPSQFLRKIQNSIQ
jgi:DNA mismatch endonuclease (patch repair protein)